jgi:hypothetical protein
VRKDFPRERASFWLVAPFGRVDLAKIDFSDYALAPERDFLYGPGSFATELTEQFRVLAMVELRGKDGENSQGRNYNNYTPKHRPA